MTADELLSVLKVSARFVAGKSGQIDIFRHLCFRDNLVYAYSGECGCALRLTVGLSCTVPADRFLALLGKFPSASEVRLDMQGTALRVRCGRSHATIPTGAVGRYPDFVPSDFVELGTPPNLATSVQRAAKLIDETARNQFAGVALAGSYVYSTDGLRATRIQLEASLADGAFFLPLRAAKLLVTLGQPSRLLAWDQMVGAIYEEPSGLWASSLLAHRFPQAHVDDHFLQAPAPEHVVVFPDEILETLNRLEVMSADAGSGVDVVSQQGNLHLVARSGEAGELVEELDWDAPSFKMRVNPRHFRQGLEISRRVDLSSVLRGERRSVRFLGNGVDHVMSLVAE